VLFAAETGRISRPQTRATPTSFKFKNFNQ
jgi:hypothetical protein